MNRVKISDGNGGEVDVYTMTANRIRVWGAAIIAILTIGGMVFAAARFGVGVEVHQAIQAEATLETGAIHREIHRCAEEYMDEVVDMIQEDMTLFDGRLQEQHDLGIRLEERQIAITQQVNDNQQELIREIRRAGGGGG